MKATIITGLTCLLLGAGVGTFLFPQIKEKTVEVEKIVKNVVTVTRIITLPDGTKEEVSTTTDRTKEDKVSTATKKASNWHASVSASSHIWPVQVDTYTIQVEKRILGDLFVGGKVSTDKTVGIVIGMEF